MYRGNIDNISRKITKNILKNIDSIKELRNRENQIKNSIEKINKEFSRGGISKREYNKQLLLWNKVYNQCRIITPIIVENILDNRVVDKSNYRYRARFDITVDNISLVKGYKLLQKLGYYNKDTNPTGVVKDHRFSIKAGKLLNIHPELLGNIKNCEFLSFEDNLKKGANCSLNYKEFMNLVASDQIKVASVTR